MADDSVWTGVFDAEEARIHERRKMLRDTDKCTCRYPDNKVGLALSGGGIRSATFSLGLMRSLSEQRLIHCVDYLSTVSGGGYAGAFYCSLFVPNRLRGRASLQPEGAGKTEAEPALCPGEGEAADDDDPAAATCDPLGSRPGRNAIAQLRQGGHYLAPNGTSDAMFAAVIAIRNWFALAITMGMALLALFFFVNLAILVLDPLLVNKEQGLNQNGYGVLELILIVLAFWPASCAWAYWFARSTFVAKSRIVRLFSMQSLVAVLIFVLAQVWPGTEEGWHGILRNSIRLLSLLSLLIYAWAQFVSFCRDRGANAKLKPADQVEALAQEDRVRNRLSRWLLRGVLVFLLTAALAVIHWASREQIFTQKFVPDIVVDPDILGLAAAVAVIIILAARSIFRGGGGGFRRPGRRFPLSPRTRQIVALIFGITLLAAFVTFWATMAGGASRWIENNTEAAWKGIDGIAPWLRDIANSWILKPLGIGFDSPQSAAPLLFLVTVKVALIAYLIGNVDSLLNRSSFSTFYSGRLRSAYLGATNAARRPSAKDCAETAAPQGEQAVPLDRDHPNDEITLAAYYDDKTKAPIHLINVTINETTSRSSRVIQRDRKGKSMTITPSGYLYPPGSPAGPLALLPRTMAEDLPLSSWMAISGAAFTTGAGHHTTLGTALLATLTNVRLGYWWKLGSPTWEWPLRRPKRLVQSYLLRELRASYEGTSDSRWYLSDGGHYENTGTYELIRRRVPFIITSDNGADPYYEFSDLVNLIRKARIDFGTEIEFLDNKELDKLLAKPRLREVFGSLDEIRKSGKEAIWAGKDPDTKEPIAGPYATLARIRYPELGSKDEPGYREASTGTLLLIKPRITGRELPDLVQYRDVNAAFPQQPTTNQFFDEAQWESYYRLGQLIGDMIFKKDSEPPATDPARWYPWNLQPLPA